MNNELTQDAEGSETIEKPAVETTASTVAGDAAQAVEKAAEAPAPTEQEEAPTAPETVEAASAEEPKVEAPEAEPVAETAAATSEPAAETPAEPAAASAEPAAPRTVKKPVVEKPAADEIDTSGDIDFGAILEQFEQEQTVFHAGELVEGKIVGITERAVLVDFGFKSEGFVPLEEFTGPDGQTTANVGDTVEVTIKTIHTGDGSPQLSYVDALGRKVWDDLETAFNAEAPVTGRVVDKTKGGLKIDINGIEAFMPGSQIDSRPIRGLETYIGEDIEAQIIKFSRRRNNIVLSRKVITDLVVNEQKAKTLATIDLGHIVTGTIKNLTEYGAFVDIGGIDGLLHVTDMSWGRIHHPGDVFKVGEQLQVKVLKLDREKEKVSLGYKQLQPDPWSTVVEVYPVNTKLKGIVSSVTEYGVFVELEAGVEGLVHVSEISWSRRAQSPKRMFQKGQEVDVQVLGVDTVEKRISLGMKQFLDNPWDTVDLRYPVGSRISGRVRNITDFGAFVELEEGIDGLVHVSDISWGKKIKHPKDILKKDQEVEAIITSIDKRGQRLSLSMKDLTPSAWEGFVATHKPGDVVRGKVSRFTNFGVFVELGEGLEGLCHISELSDERVDNPQSVANLGDEMDFKILRIEPVEQKIGLSHRAVGKDDEPIVDSRIYSTEAKGGMASLGELAKLKSGADAEPVEEDDPEARKRAKAAAKEAKAKEFAAKEAARIEAEAKSAEDAASAEEAAADAPAEAATEETAEAATEEVAATEETKEDAPAAEADEAPAAEAPAEEAPAAETEEAPAAEAPADEAPAAEAEEAPAAEAPADEAPAAEVDEAPAAEAPAEEEPAAEVEETPAAEAPAEEPATEETPSAEAETADEPKAEASEESAEDEAAAEDSEKKSA